MAKKKKSLKLTSSSAKKDKEGGETSRKRGRTDTEDVAEERRLTALLFGGAFDENQKQSDSDENESEDEEEGNLEISGPFFELDRSGVDQEESETVDIERNDTEEDESDNDEDDVASDKPAWVDDDDEDVTVNLLETDRLKKLRNSRSEQAPLDGAELERRLRKRFEDTAMATARTDWADIESRERKDEDDQEESNPLESSSASLLASSFDRLPPQVLNVVRCPDANQSDPNQAVVQAVNFHTGSDPDRPLMLTAGLDKTLRFFQVDAEESQKIHGIYCKQHGVIRQTSANVIRVSSFC